MHTCRHARLPISRDATLHTCIRADHTPPSDDLCFFLQRLKEYQVFSEKQADLPLSSSQKSDKLLIGKMKN